MNRPARLSIVLPVLNERALLGELHRRIDGALAGSGVDVEVLAVNDGSSDDSLAELLAIRARDPRWKIIDLSRNFGHGSACTAGLHAARGDAIVFMDSDLQDPPELIAKLLEKWREGYQVVYGLRTRRKEAWPRRAATAAFYRALNLLSDVTLPPHAGIFSLVDRQVAEELRRLPESHRYLTGLRSWVGFRQTHVPYVRQGRRAGSAKQTLARLSSLASDALFSFSMLPLRLATLMGGLLALFAFLFGLRIVYLKLYTDRPIVGWSSVMVAVLVIGGMILATLGILGEYVGRIYTEAKHRPQYIIRQTFGLDADAGPAARVERRSAA